jgi:uncharacterized membrane protein
MPETPQTSNRGLMIVLAYLWPLALVPFVLEKDNAEIQWHAKHGLVLMVAELIVLLAFTMVSSMIGLVTLWLGCVVSFLAVPIWIAFIAIHAIAIVKGLNGSRLVIPHVSEYAERF